MAPLSLLASLHQGEDVHYIDGGEKTDNGLVATSPSDQARIVDKILDGSRNTRSLIYTQSLGALAAVRYLEHSSNTQVQAVAIAPPLPDPLKLLHHSRIVSRMHQVKGKYMMPSYSFALGASGPSALAPTPIDVRIDDSYFADVAANSRDFLERVKRLLEDRLLKLVLPTRDWNSEASNSVAGLQGVFTVDGTHSLHSTPEDMVNTATEIYNIATFPTDVVYKPST